METMELCVTACEKFSNNNEVLPSAQVAPQPLLTLCVIEWPQMPVPAQKCPAGTRPKAPLDLVSLEAGAGGWC